MKVADSKREEFRKYLEKAGVMDALTKGEFLVDFQFILFLLLSFFPCVGSTVLVNLYEEPEKPANALEYPL